MKTLDKPVKEMEKPFKDIFQNILNSLGITYYRMSKDTGLTTAQLSKLLRGTKPGRDTIAAIYKTYPQLNINYILFGTGDVLVSGNAKPLDMEFDDVAYVPIKTYATFISSYDETKPIKLEKYPIIMKGINTKNCLLIEVNGNAMRPTINHGAKVLADKVERGNWGDASGVVAILYKDFLVVQRIRENELNHFKRLTLYSDNINGGTLTIDAPDIREMWKVSTVYNQTVE